MHKRVLLLGGPYNREVVSLKKGITSYKTMSRQQSPMFDINRKNLNSDDTYEVHIYIQHVDLHNVFFYEKMHPEAILKMMTDAIFFGVDRENKLYQDHPPEEYEEALYEIKAHATPHYDLINRSLRRCMQDDMKKIEEEYERGQAN